MDVLDNYPFLRAALEDYLLVARIDRDHVGNPRHAVCLMHDAIEFVIYEVLTHRDVDIYRDGQHTIGLDEALAAYRRCEIDLPLIGAVRAIQKHRGDAKHHAQHPEEKAYRRLLSSFRIIVSRLVHEHFGQTLGKAIWELGLIPYHQALFDCYRKYRNHNWNMATRFSIGAVLHKHRDMMGMADDYVTGRTPNHLVLVAALRTDIEKAAYPEARPQLLDKIRALPAVVHQCVEKDDLPRAAAYAGGAYSQIDEVLPSVFDIKKARRLTSRLFQPKELIFSGSMGWSHWQSGDTAEKKVCLAKVSELLKHNPEIVRGFGQLYYAEDDDRDWKWWEFAVFDGERWVTFHIDDHFEISLESEITERNEEDGKRREHVARVICEEFFTLAKKEPPVATSTRRQAQSQPEE